MYRFLNKFAGIRYYVPGDLGTIIPQSKDFTVETQEYYDAPAFRERMFGAVWFQHAEKDWLYWHHRLFAGGERCHINHSYNYMRRYQKTNPEFFALIGGERDFGKLSTANNYGNLCMTNKEGIKAFAKIAADFFDRNPDFAVFPIVPQDGMYKVCECPDCKKLYSPHLGEEGKFSNLVFHHAIEVAKILKKKSSPQHTFALCDIIAPCRGQDNTRAAKQDHEQDKSSGHKTRNSCPQTHFRRRMEIPGLRQTFHGTT